MLKDNIRSYSICSDDTDIKKKKGKVHENEFYIIEMKEHYMMKQFDYNVSQLKRIAKNYKIKVSGNKNELRKRIYTFLQNSWFSIIIQKYLRRHYVKKFLKLKGPAIMNRSLCTNTQDFYSLSNINEIEFSNFISFNNDNNVFGYEITSLLYYLKSNKNVIKNPYTGIVFSNEEINSLNRVIKMTNVLYPELDLKSVEKEILQQQELQPNNIKNKYICICQKIDELGHYSQINWFYKMNNRQAIRFIKELKDIWVYRAQLTNECKKKICYPHGKPFSFIESQITIIHTWNITTLHNIVIRLCENFLFKSFNDEHAGLGAFYVLGALTIVNNDAASALPWLFQSVMHIQ
jgi:hypothetical protein